MGNWAKVLLSGSNMAVNELTASGITYLTPGSIPENRIKVVTRNGLSALLYYTGSYGAAGETSETVNWFPYEGDLILSASTNPTTRSLFIGKDRDTAGSSHLKLDVNGGASNNSDFAFLNTSGVNSVRTINHSGTGDLKVDLSASIATNDNKTTRGFASDDPNNAWLGENSLIGDNTGDAFTTLNGMNNRVRLALGAQLNIPFIYASGWNSLPFYATLIGIQVNIRARTSGGTTIPLRYRLTSGNGNIISNIGGTNVSSTSYATYTLGGPTNLLGFPQTGGGLSYEDGGGNSVLYSNTNRVADIFGAGQGSQLIYLEIWADSGASTSNRLYLEGTATLLSAFPSVTLYYYDSINDKNFVLNFPTSNIEALTVPLDGQMRIHTPPTFAGGVPLQLNGELSGAVVYASLSTNKVKTNIKSLDDSILKDFDKLNPVTFKYINNPNNIEGGFIAEEAAEANPIFAEYKPNHVVSKGHILINQPPIDDTLVPLDISDRGIIAAAVKKLQYLDQKLTSL